jgi:tricorn protease
MDVPLDPIAVNEDRDPQLDAAIAEVLEELKSAKPIPLKSAPPMPTQIGK